jgi:hypothetical protein
VEALLRHTEHLLLLFGRGKLRSTVNAAYCRGAGASSHLDRILLLRCCLLLAYIMENCFTDARINYSLVLSELLNFMVEVVAVKQRLNRMTSKLKEILFELFVL